MTFKVGDKIKIKNNLKGIDCFSSMYNEKLKQYAGNIVTIESITGCWVTVEENYCVWDVRALEKVKFTKRDLKAGDKITLKNGDSLIVDEDIDFRDYSKNCNNYLCELYDLDDDLTSRDESYQDIVKVERPTYKTIYERNEDEEKEEMTIEEIEEVLGYGIKVVGGNE